MTQEKPKDPATPKPTTGRTYDGLLDPLPLPDVVESDSDTAWGRWEDSLQVEPTDSELKDVEPDYDDTVPMAFLDDTTPPKTNR